MINEKKRILVVLLINMLIISINAQFEVKKFGAVGDGKTLDTKSIQSAINKANSEGGGVVDISSGTYLIGTLILKDNVELHLEIGAVLLGSPDYKDYTRDNS
jgi:polygalacturonase